MPSTRPPWQQTASLVVTLAFPLVTAFLGWTASTVIEQGKDLASLKASRYSASDAANDELRRNAQMQEIRDLLHAIENKGPPAWFEKRVASLELELQRIRADIQDLKSER